MVSSWYLMVPYGTIWYRVDTICGSAKTIAPPPIRCLYATYTQLYARPIRLKYTPDSPIRSLYVRLYAGPYTPEYCFAWCWPPCSLQKRSSKMLPHLCKKCCHPITDLNASGHSFPLSVRPTIRPSHHPSIFPVFIAPFSYTPTYTSAIRRYTLYIRPIRRYTLPIRRNTPGYTQPIR